MSLTPDAAIGPAAEVQAPPAAVPGFSPGHRQGRHARLARQLLAPSWPERTQRAPARIERHDTDNPQRIPIPRSTDQADQTGPGVEGSARPGQQPLAGWDGEPGASAPDATRSTIW